MLYKLLYKCYINTILPITPVIKKNRQQRWEKTLPYSQVSCCQKITSLHHYKVLKITFG